MANLATLVMVAGVLHAGVLAAAALVPGKLRWREELGRVSRLTRQLVWVHGGFVTMTIAGLGLVSVLSAEELVSGTRLARSVCAFAAVFWGARLVLVCFMHPGEHVRGAAAKVGCTVLIGTFVYLTGIYAWAATGGGS